MKFIQYIVWTYPLCKYFVQTKRTYQIVANWLKYDPVWLHSQLQKSYDGRMKKKEVKTTIQDILWKTATHKLISLSGQLWRRCFLYISFGPTLLSWCCLCPNPFERPQITMVWLCFQECFAGPGGNVVVKTSFETKRVLLISISVQAKIIFLARPL